MPAPANRLASVLGRLDRLPAPVARRARTLLVRNAVRFVGTARLDIDELGPERAVVRVENRRRVHNHLGTVHAAAVVLTAESATGLLVGLHVPDDRAPVLKSMKVEFKKRTKGSVRAEASLTRAQIEAIATQEKGEVNVAVRVIDSADAEPVQCEMIWAWTPKRRAG